MYAGHCQQGLGESSYCKSSLRCSNYLTSVFNESGIVLNSGIDTVGFENNDFSIELVVCLRSGCF